MRCQIAILAMRMSSELKLVLGIYQSHCPGVCNEIDV
jgi:hypothetical protein